MPKLKRMATPSVGEGLLVELSYIASRSINIKTTTNIKYKTTTLGEKNSKTCQFLTKLNIITQLFHSSILQEKLETQVHKNTLQECLWKFYSYQPKRRNRPCVSQQKKDRLYYIQNMKYQLGILQNKLRIRTTRMSLKNVC